MPLSVADNESNVSFNLMFYYIIFSKVALIRYKRFYAGENLHFYIDNWVVLLQIYASFEAFRW